MSQDAMNERLMEVFKTLKKMGLVTTKTAFMEAIGQSKQHFGGFEDGSRKVHPKHITMLSNQFGVNPDYLLSGKLPILKEGSFALEAYTITGNRNSANIQGGSGNKVTGTDATLKEELEACRRELMELQKEHIALLKKVQSL